MENIEDTFFILNMRIRMIRDLLHLEADPAFFLEQTLADLRFLDSALEALQADIDQSVPAAGRKGAADGLSDLEWQFNQLLTEFPGVSSPFSAERFPDTREQVALLKNRSDGRRTALDKSAFPAEREQDEPLVSPAEMSGLLGGL